MARKKAEPTTWWTAAADPECPLCERVIPKSQQDEHHLVPKVKGGKETKTLHRICHRQIHALFSEAELAQQYRTTEALLAHPEVRKFVNWVKHKPPEFCESVKMSHRKR